MNFLALTINDVPSIISRAFRSLFAFMCELLYPLIGQLYNVFYKMGLLFYNDTFQSVYNRISLILGIFMVFRVTFWLIEILVNPDKMTDKEKNPSKIIVKVLVSIVMLAITPTIFKYAFRIQYEVVNSHSIEKLIVFNSSNISDNVGRELSGNLFSNFYSLRDEKKPTNECAFAVDPMKGYVTQLKEKGELYMSSNCLNSVVDTFSDKEDATIKVYELNFNGLYATLVGCVVCWLLLMYCISVGTRYVQLIFLQIIAPIPIMCYVTPGKDNMFDKWVKQCTVTYLDLFIRVAIISFAMLLCQVIFSDGNILSIPNFEGGWIARIAIVLGLLTFAKKAPDLIQELLPKSVTKASGDFGLSWKKRKDAMLGGKQIFGAASAVAKGVPIGLATGVVGAAGGRGWGRLSGFFGGVARGTINGGKKGNAFKNLNASIQKQNQVNKRKIDWANSGSTWSGRMAQRLDNAFGLTGTAEGYENQVNKSKDKINATKRVAESQGRVIQYTSDAKNEAKSKLTEKKEQEGFAKRLQSYNSTFAAIANHMNNGNLAAAKSEIAAERKNIEGFKSYILDRKNEEISKIDQNDPDRERKISKINDKYSKEEAAFDKIKEKQLKKLKEVEDKLNNNEYTASAASTDANTILNEVQEQYVDAAFNGIIDNQKIDGIKENVQKVRDEFDSMIQYAEDNGVSEKYINELKSKRDIFAAGDLTGFDVLKRMDDESKSLKRTSDSNIEDLQKSIDDIQASQDYQRAVADRNAVGGSSGKKS